MLTTRHIRELWTHVWEEKRLVLQTVSGASKTSCFPRQRAAISCNPMPAQGTEDTCTWLECHSVRVQQGWGAEEGNKGGQPGPTPQSPSVGLAAGIGWEARPPGKPMGMRPVQGRDRQAVCRSGSGLVRITTAGHSPVQWAKEKTGRRLPLLPCPVVLL